MQVLFEELSAKGPNTIYLLPTPKYHPEIVGQGIEYVWGLAKRKFRWMSLEDKKGKQRFEDAIKESIRFVTKDHVNSFAAKCRRYMMAHANQGRHTRDSPPQLTYEGIERFQRMFKTHRNIADQEKPYLAEMWKASVI